MTGDVRHSNGHVTGLQYIDTSDDGDSRYRLTVRPWLWLLTRNADCRIFQQMSIFEIVTQVFQDRGFTDFEKTLFEECDQRECVVQYRETDSSSSPVFSSVRGSSNFFRVRGREASQACDVRGASRAANRAGRSGAERGHLDSQWAAHDLGPRMVDRQRERRPLAPLIVMT
jgi:Phage tail baseplate hub (GPD)